jgi:apolipoprotein N-acyltransferase
MIMTNLKNTWWSSRAFLLMAGSILIILTFMRFGIGELGWIVYAPLLVYVHEKRNLKQHLLLLAVLIVAYIITITKIVTSEIPWAITPMFAVPCAFSCFVSLAVAGVVHRRLGVRAGVYAFALLTVVLNWIQYSFTPGASWGVLAHTQINNLPLIQMSALTGLGGITFLLALGSGFAAAAWSNGFHSVRKDVVAFALILFCVLLYGQLRLSHTSPGEMIRVGGVVSPVDHEAFRGAMINVDTLRPLDSKLFERTEHAASLGAKVIVWNEVATVVTAEGEQALVSRGQQLAKDKGVLLCMAYGVAVSMNPFWYANKYRIYLPDGTMADEYIKRHPVPGDPHDAGLPHARAVPFSGLKFSGGICYDYSFPEIARDNANDGAGLALVPASDWRGIDPQHGRMALMNAVAAGLPMIRPVRAATSIACDQYGRLLGTMPWQNSSDGVFVVNMPAARVPTLYAMTGELIPLFAVACLVIIFVVMFVAHNKGKHLSPVN